MNAEPENSQLQIPKHVAIIMDGNGRWAEQRKRPRVFGHQNGVAAVRNAVEFAANAGIQGLTLFAFSSENWKRPEQEVSTLMELFFSVLTKEVKKLHRNNIRMNIIGDRQRFSQKLQEKIASAEQLTAENTGMQLNIAANYGGRWDIVNACRQFIAECQERGEDPQSITEESIMQNLALADLPELDLLIRTGGDHRISNFLLWQAAYTELYFTELLWPDFDNNAFADALASYASRERRFGCTGAQIRAQLNQ